MNNICYGRGGVYCRVNIYLDLAVTTLLLTNDDLTLHYSMPCCNVEEVGCQDCEQGGGRWFEQGQANGDWHEWDNYRIRNGNVKDKWGSSINYGGIVCQVWFKFNMSVSNDNSVV